MKKIVSYVQMCGKIWKHRGMSVLDWGKSNGIYIHGIGVMMRGRPSRMVGISSPKLFETGCEVIKLGCLVKPSFGHSSLKLEFRLEFMEVTGKWLSLHLHIGKSRTSSSDWICWDENSSEIIDNNLTHFIGVGDGVVVQLLEPSFREGGFLSFAHLIQKNEQLKISFGINSVVGHVVVVVWVRIKEFRIRIVRELQREDYPDMKDRRSRRKKGGPAQCLEVDKKHSFLIEGEVDSLESKKVISQQELELPLLLSKEVV
ncbi:hypothetical protein HD554DRAFT_2038259 [Boletus coccyginus]|nr:hypothetical protein HD554DRAFT_2038259 [Boletus coccyginus]